MSYLLIEALELTRKRPERIFSVEEIASHLNVSPKTVRYYSNDLVDTGFVETVSAGGKEYYRALPGLLKVNSMWMRNKQGMSKNDNKVPYNSRIAIERIRRFYDVAKRKERSEEDKVFIDELSRDLLNIGERTSVYSKGSAGKWVRHLSDLRQAILTSEKIVAIDSVVSFIHGRGRIAPLLIKAKRWDIVRLLDSIAKD